MTFNLSWRFLHRLPSHLTGLLVRFISNQENLMRSNNPSMHCSYTDLFRKYCESMTSAAAFRSISIAQKLHAQLIRTGLVSSTFLQNHLINVYSKCGFIDDAYRVFTSIGSPNVFSWNVMISGLAGSGRMSEAEQVFDQMLERDSVSWNSMMSGYFNNGRYRHGLKVFALMIWEGDSLPGPLSFSCVMKACARLGYQKLAFQLHGLVEKFDFGRDVSIQSSIIDMYIKCGALDLAEQVFLRVSNPSLFCWNIMIYGYWKLYDIESALDLFNQMPERDAVSWNTIISILSQQGYGNHSRILFVDMWNQGFGPNPMTYASILSACTNMSDLGWGAHLHARIIRMEQNLDVYVASGLINMYAKCGCLESARQIFNNLTEHNVVAWTSLIAGVAQFGHGEEALELFKRMREVPVALDEFTIATVFGVCSSLKDISLGAQHHAYAIKTGMDCSVAVVNALIIMYTKCGDVQRANRAFDLMPIRDTITWTVMVTSLSQNGDVGKALEYFNKMPERNVVTWNSMLSIYTKHGVWEESLKLYILMLREGVKPDWVSFATLTSACADSAVLKLGSQIVAQAEKLGFGFNVSVANSVITMYSRCGSIEEAHKVFDSIVLKDLISWNAMMDGYVQSGQGRKVLEIFENMLKMGFTPDNISYVSVLSGCSHSGLVSEGQHYFDMMTKEHDISPTYEHFACMVDLLGRAGLLEQAKNMIDEMPLEPNAVVWGALLCACRIHGNAKLAEISVKNLIELDAGNSGCYVLLANTYSDCGHLDFVLNVRKFLREKGIQKNPGCSWIEVDNRVHVFTVDDTSHPQIKDIYSMLSEITKKIEDRRYRTLY
ncbi:tetratricopeptide repeat (TPR)-like superfamily protein [Actinidia rufa]|uniref:Tetratricopeptide repeat (TPR)-like superfamily protein n=1 Tax=Actinidia rufa TaxID=165716 RepID=A0A7J0EJ64_9ERIC|nr:tetratricopeptide repeat (TPR)-like superfamily protein [Actinidia rufa]GFY86322.1 tetratricopeptide repeat (TPR)-like superfamily protein [Actinidia rufa]